MFGYLSGHLQKLHWRSRHSSLLIRFLVLSSMWEVYWWNLPPPATAEVLFGVHKTRVKGLRFISCSGVNWATWFKWAISFDADRSSGAFDPCIYWMHHQWGTRYGQNKKHFPEDFLLCGPLPRDAVQLGSYSCVSWGLQNSLSSGHSENLADLPTENVPGHIGHVEISKPGIQHILAK